MDAGDLKPSDVLPWLDKSDPRLRATAEWVLGHHTPWGTELTESFRSQLRSPAISPVKRGALNAQLHLFADSSTTQGFLAELTSDLSMDSSTRIAALEAISGAGLKESPDVWNTAIAAILSEPASKPELLTAAVHAASHGQSNSGVAKGLHSVAVNPGNSTELRLTALETLPPGELTSNEFDFLKRRLEASSPPNQRSMAAETIAKSKLTEAQKSEIAILVAVASPLELTKLLGTFDAGGSDALGQSLLDSLEKSASARSLVPSQVTSHFSKFSEAIQVSAKRFANSINVDAARQGASLEALLTELKSIGGDIRRGQALFNGPKAACSSCHRIGYLGGEVGPELTNIGEARTERDLLESIVYPSASFVRSFEPSVITLNDGDQVNGIIRHESPEELTVATGPGPEIRIKRSNVADTKPGTVSVMPAGLADALTRTELADILTFVKTVRWR
jgi:putative heme-binding domain-containing protein